MRGHFSSLSTTLPKQQYLWSTKRIKEAILRDGFLVIPAPEVGERVHIFGEKKYPFRSVDGLTFLRDTLADVVRSLVPVRRAC